MPKPAGPRQEYSLLATASTLTAALVLGTGGGFVLDQKFHTSFVFTVAGWAIAMIYCLYEGWRLLNPPQDPPASKD